jgi:endonuclease/exonuclease/phosphatase family metal-dependent hydrolase
VTDPGRHAKPTHGGDDDHAPACRVSLEPDRHDELHAELDHWRANVGEPVAVDCAADAPPELRGVDVLCWNVAIGLGRLDDVVGALRAGTWGGAASDPAWPLVILVQEAYRQDDTVPGASASRHHGGLAPQRGVRADIVQVARELGMSVRYSPSMRNGAHPSDRGNAVLSTARLEGARALLLPYVRQRRVAVTARLAGHPELTFVSAHLDTHGRPRRGTDPARPTRRPVRFGAGRVVQAQALAAAVTRLPGSVVLGADLNSMLGMSDPVIRTLVAAGMHPARRVGAWRHTFHTPLRMLLDHVLYRCVEQRIDRAEVVRLDEAPRDRSQSVFGSDHHPLLARIHLKDG